MRACFKCKDVDPTVMPRERTPRGLRVLCSACYVDVSTSSTRAVRVPEREQHDYYAQMAARLGVK